MDFSLTDDQVMIRDAAQDFLADNSSSEAVRAAMASEQGFDPAVWQTVAAELGWCAVAVPEAQGGMGMGPVELMLIQEQAGYYLLCAPFFSTVCLGANLIQSLGSEAACNALLPPVVEGDSRLAVSLSETTELMAQQVDGQWRLNGSIDQVCHADTQSTLLLFANTDDGNGLGLFAVPGDAAGVQITAMPGWDTGRRFAHVTLKDAPASQRCDEASKLQTGGRRATALARLYLAAEQLGAAQRCLELTTAYVAERKQFGRVIGSFQAVKHRCAQMMVQVEAARSAIYGAAALASHEGDVDELSTECAMAKALASEALFFCAAEAIQLHGGVGFTEEYDPGLYFKRAQASKNWLGSPDQLRKEIAEVLL